MRFDHERADFQFAMLSLQRLWRSLLAPAKQSRRFSPKAKEFFILGVVLFHPLHSLVKPLAGQLFFALPLASHRNEKPIEAVAAGAEFHRLLQRVNRVLPV